MATSSSSNFTRTRDQICHAAARKILALRAGATMPAQMMTDFSEALNAMVKHWQGRGLHVWTVEEATLFLQNDQIAYALSSASGSDHATQSHVETTLSAAASEDDTTFTVSSASGLTAADFIAIELDSGSYQWTTIGSTSSTTITPDDAVSGDAASGARVLAYTSKIIRPLKIVSARRYTFSDARDVPIEIISRLEYRGLPNKTQEGTVSQVFYDPRGGANAAGVLYVYQEPDDLDDCIKFTWWRPIEDFDAAGDNPDLPQEWIQTLIFNLALVMAPEFSADVTLIAPMAQQFLSEMEGWDREEEPLMFGVDMG